MNSVTKRHLSLLLIIVLLFASVQSVFAGQFSQSNKTDDHSAIVGEFTSSSHSHDYLLDHAISNSEFALSDRHCETSADSTSLCGACNFCAHCVACLPDLPVINNRNNTINYLFLITSHFYLDLPTKDRPPRNA